MKVLIVGKKGNVTYWMENVLAAFRAEGYEAAGFSTTGDGLPGRLELSLVKRLHKSAFCPAIARQFVRAATAFRPDVIVFIHAFEVVPVEVYHAVQGLPRRPVMIGWVGDRFHADQIEKARFLDHLFFTDSGFIDDAGRYGFPGNYSYLAHAANPALFRPGSGTAVNGMVFVANFTPHRGRVLSALTAPVAVYGRGWNRMTAHGHNIHNHLIGIRRVAKLYGRYRAVLNVKNELNVICGLNQRNFEPLACKSVLITERMQDLERCFEPGIEVLVYAEAGACNEHYQRIREDPAFAGRIAEAGYRRVLAEHTYAHRVRTMMQRVELGGK